MFLRLGNLERYEGWAPTPEAELTSLGFVLGIQSFKKLPRGF